MPARQFYHAESLAETTSVSTAPASKVALVFTPDASSDYFIFCSAQATHDSAAEDDRAIVELYDPGAAVVWDNQVKAQELAGPQDWMSCFGVVKYTAGASPLPVTFDLRFASSAAATTARIRNARVIALKADAADQYAIDFDKQGTSSIAADAVTLAFTPATDGDYLVIAVAAIAAETNGGRVSARLVHINTVATYGFRETYVRDNLERRVFAVSPKIALTATTQTFKVRYSSPDNATLVTVTRAAILVLRLDRFDEVFQGQDYAITPVSTTQTSYQDALVVAGTPAAVRHLLVGTCAQRINSNTRTGYHQLLADVPSVVFGEYTQENVNAASFYGVGVAAVVACEAAPTNWRWQYKTESTNAVYGADVSIAVLRLEQTRITSGGFDAAVTRALAAIAAVETAVSKPLALMAVADAGVEAPIAASLSGDAAAMRAALAAAALGGAVLGRLAAAMLDAIVTAAPIRCGIIALDGLYAGPVVSEGEHALIIELCGEV